MAPENDSFRAAILAKVSAWQAVLDSYDAAVAIDGPLGDATVQTPGPAAGATPSQTRHKAHDLPVGIFRDKSLKDAIVIYLEAGRRKQTNKEIADGLKKGGIATTSANFEPTVATALYRLKQDGIVLRFDDGWDLAASYPEGFRARLESKGKQPQAKKKADKRRRVGKRTAKAAKTQKATATTDAVEAHLRAV